MRTRPPGKKIVAPLAHPRAASSGKTSTAPPANKGSAATSPKPGLHARNRHRQRYDFAALTLSSPTLVPFVATNTYGDPSIDFSNPDAVKALNRALLAHFYAIAHWDIPDGYLCPPIPGRADYLHHLADLLASFNGGVIPCGADVRVLDIGVGANCIYPLIGQREYGWSFVGSDIDPVALAASRKIIDGNAGLTKDVSLRLQTVPTSVFGGLLEADESFDLVMCNPPFHASRYDAELGSRRKWENLGKVSAVNGADMQAPRLNFAGQGSELWCEGGEAAFVGGMIEESAEIPTSCLWFSSLISKESNLPGVHAALKDAKVYDVKTIDMAQGHKKSRVVAWTFLGKREQEAWHQKTVRRRRENEV